MKNRKRDYFVSCIVAAGGSSRRMGNGINKLFLEIGNIPVIARTLIALENSEYIDEVIVSAKEEDIVIIGDIAKMYKIRKLKSIVKGGNERSDSVKSAICEISPCCDIVAVHDGARPFVSEKVISETVMAAYKYGCAACGVRPKCTLKKEDENGFISDTVDRNMVYEIQTPQVFSKDLFFKAYEADDTILHIATDDCTLIERLGEKIKITQGSYRNIKITTTEDIVIGEALIEGE